MSNRFPACCALVVGCLAFASGVATGDQTNPPSLRERVRRLAESTLAHRCLTPAIDGVFNQTVQSGAFRPALGTTFSLTDVSARDGSIDLTIAKPGRGAHAVTLALERVVGRRPDGRAGNFLFYLQAGGEAESSGVLLELARVLAERIPDTALAPCQSRADAFATRTVALLGATFAVLAVVAALLLGFRKLGRAARVERIP